MDGGRPSASNFLQQPPIPSDSLPATVKKATKPRGAASTATNDANVQNGGIPGSKRSKSRSGCLSCKKKRVKCDEAKPTCGQCEKRNIECDGYKIQYKWRSFEDTTKQSRAGKPKKPRNTIAPGNNAAANVATGVHGDAPAQQDTANGEYLSPLASPTSLYLDQEFPWSPNLQVVCSYASQAFTGRLPPTDNDEFATSRSQHDTAQFDPWLGLNSALSNYNAGFLSSFHASRSQYPSSREAFRYLYTADSLPAADVLPPENDMRYIFDPFALYRSRYISSYDEAECNEASLPSSVSNLGDQDAEELNQNRRSNFAPEDSNPRERPTEISSDRPQASANFSQTTDLTLFNAPYLDPSSPEMLMLRFDKETCGILSIKDGPSENPWRTLVWPLAKDSHALYHAISAMAALHGATTLPSLRVTGMAHMTKSISNLSAEMHSMSLNQVLASSLALCLSESWDDKISTGIKHLKGAKTVLNKALAQHSSNLKLGQLSRQDAESLKFLSNTFVYLDAIARLTSSEEHNNIDLHDTVQAVNESFDSKIDPLMGCATTLFPLLGKVGSLIQRVRRTSTNSLSVISEANQLREQLLQWEPPDMDSFEQPEDPSSNIRHALQTAEAYRRAILLHLHSAVTELSSEPSYDQAKNTLSMIAATPLSSRTMIVQIFPLLVGSCEMIQPDDRQWVAQRWDAMIKRLAIVSVSSCWKVVKEVWRRRDAHVKQQAEQTSRTANRSVSPTQYIPRMDEANRTSGDKVTKNTSSDRSFNVEGTAYNNPGQTQPRSPTLDASCSLVPRRNLVRLPRRHTDVSLLSGGIEYSVRGRLHWLGVMSDWNWEVFL